MSEVFPNRPTTLADYVAILRRRKWFILGAPVLAVLAGLVVSASESSVYHANAQVLVNRTSVVSAITNVSDPAIGDPIRFLSTEASIARASELARRVVDAAGVPGMTPSLLLASSSVHPRKDADILDVGVDASTPSVAIRLANTYAAEFTLYKTQLDTTRINEALASLKSRTDALRARGIDPGTPAYATLLQYQGQLETVGKLLANNTKVLEQAASAPKIRPRPKRDALLSLLLGGILGVGLALLAEGLDRRVRSEEEIEQALGLPLLARAAKPPRRIRKADQLVMLAEPTGPPAEAFRKLRTNIEFLNLDQGARTIMVTSAAPREGKSTTIANLAVALARAGRRVVLVDLDLRRPYLHRFFDLTSGPGFTDVAVGRSKLTEVMRPIALISDPILPLRRNKKVRRKKGRDDRRQVSQAKTANSNGRSQVGGVLNFLPAGTLPPAPGEFLDSDRVDTILSQLGEGFDFVLVDAPPLLAFGDTFTLSGKVDALFVVARLGYVQRMLLQELARQLQSSPAKPIGFVVTGAPSTGAYAYGYDYGQSPSEATRSAQRVS
jgi:polysaccharide biosynthesis transport protein